MVPALPGSRTSSRIATSFGGDRRRGCPSRAIGNWRQTATNALRRHRVGHRVEHVLGDELDLEAGGGRRLRRSRCSRSRARRRGEQLETSSGRKVSASATAWGPRKETARSRPRAPCLASLATARTRGERGLSSMPQVYWRPDDGLDATAARHRRGVGPLNAKMLLTQPSSGPTCRPGGPSWRSRRGPRRSRAR